MSFFLAVSHCHVTIFLLYLLLQKPIFHTQIKHIEVNYHFVREKVSRKDLSVHYTSTQDQLADIFTKGLQPRMVAVPQVQAIGA